MYLGYQNNEQGTEFIAFASDTRDMFEQYIEVDGVKKYVYPTTRIEETSEPVEMVKGVYYVGQTAIDNAKNAEKIAEVKAKRRELLEESDLWMLADRYANLTDAQKTELTTYRQDLRDITSQSGYPWNVVYPTRPSWFDNTSMDD